MRRARKCGGGSREASISPAVLPRGKRNRSNVQDLHTDATNEIFKLAVFNLV